ncbi:unnamed protein product [Euphydryas editha]|uniref:Uncharacterized protein n=1 Tax=Euphydryas editha TaxID=104508 RepID=A0AAU9UA99_EUPED|nr:unnamed protein product [Euphydryas editha]
MASRTDDQPWMRLTWLLSDETSVQTYGISVWADTLKMQESRKRIAPVYRRSPLKVTSDLRTVYRRHCTSLGVCCHCIACGGTTSSLLAQKNNHVMF